MTFRKVISVATFILLAQTTWANTEFMEEFNLEKQEVFRKYSLLLEFPESNVFGTDSAPDKDPMSPVWWEEEASKAITQGPNSFSSEIDTLVNRALETSNQIKVFSDIPVIRETAIQEAAGDFDPEVFVQGEYGRINEPVGSTLTTGTADRFREHDASIEAGVRKKIITGGTVEISQKFSWTDNNSDYFVPNEQGYSQFTVSIAQPILQGAGITYNASPVKLAKIDASIALDEFRRQAESHLVEIHRAYWGLYYERAFYLQKRRLAQWAREIVDEMKERQDVDGLQSEMAKAEAALSRRQAALARAQLGINNAQSRILALVNAPELYESTHGELVPVTAPVKSSGIQIDLGRSIRKALQNRPEIDQAIKQLVAGRVRRKMAENELLPTLDLYAEAYVAGLRGDYGVEQAYDDQWASGRSDDEISYLVGFIFEHPLFNDADDARYTRRRAEVRQLTNQLQTLVETLSLEVKVSVHEVETSLRELRSHKKALDASAEDLRILNERGPMLLGSGTSGSEYIQEVLDAQDRVANAEESYLRSLVVYNIALVNLCRVEGELLKSHGVEIAQRMGADDLPEYYFIEAGQ
jgi:outer membrane protein TolC